MEELTAELHAARQQVESVVASQSKEQQDVSAIIDQRDDLQRQLEAANKGSGLAAELEKEVGDSAGTGANEHAHSVTRERGWRGRHLNATTPQLRRWRS